MILLPAILVGFSIFDLLPSTLPPPPVDRVSYAQTGTGDLTVSLQPETVGSVPKGAQGVRLATLMLSASCQADIRVTSVRLSHVGLGNVADLSAVTLSDGERRLARSRTFDLHSKTADIQLRNTVIPACDALRIFVLADISPDAVAASEHGVGISVPSDVVSSAKRTFLQGVPDEPSVVASPYTQGKISVNFLPVSGRLSYGHREVVARIQLSADNVTGHFLHTITLTNEEDARDMDFLNFTIEKRAGGILSGPAIRMRGRTVTIDFTPPFLLERGSTVVLVVKADVHTSVRHKLRLKLEEPSDLTATPARPR